MALVFSTINKEWKMRVTVTSENGVYYVSAISTDPANRNITDRPPLCVEGLRKALITALDIAGVA